MTRAVRMFVGTEGDYYDGEGWHTYPGEGEVGVFDDLHAEQLVNGGRGEYVAEERAAEPEDTREPDPGAETRGGADEPEHATAKPPPAARRAAGGAKRT